MSAAAAGIEILGARPDRRAFPSYRRRPPAEAGGVLQRCRVAAASSAIWNASRPWRLFSRRTGDPNVQNVTTTTMTAEASRWGNAGTKLLLASGVAGTIA